MDELASDLVDLGCRGASEEQPGLVAPVVEDPVEHEADRVCGDEGNLAGGAEHPAEVVDGRGVDAVPRHDLDDRVAERRGEEVGDRRPPRVLESGEDPLRGDRTRIRRHEAIRGDDGLDSGEDVALELEVLRGGLDHPVAAGEGAVVERRRQARLDGGSQIRSELVAGEPLGHVGLDPCSGGVERRLDDVDEDHLETGDRARQVVGDVGADRSGADDADAGRQRPAGCFEHRVGTGRAHDGVILLLRRRRRALSLAGRE